MFSTGPTDRFVRGPRHTSEPRDVSRVFDVTGSWRTVSHRRGIVVMPTVRANNQAARVEISRYIPNSGQRRVSNREYLGNRAGDDRESATRDLARRAVVQPLRSFFLIFSPASEARKKDASRATAEATKEAGHCCGRNARARYSR